MKLPNFTRHNLDWLPTFYISHVRECFFRLPRLKKHLHDVGLANYHIIEAFNGWHDTAIHRDPPAMSLGHYGCALSKMEIIEKYGGNNITFFGEDDVRFHKDWKEKLLAVLSVIPGDWEVLHLGALSSESEGQADKTQIAENLWVVSNSICLPATLLRGERIQKIFCEFTRGEWHIGETRFYTCDWYLGALCREHNITQYCVYPQIATQLEGYSFADMRWQNHHASFF
jgi:GR25 family glycosyltransferase involved in LPS biosynthesis